MSYNSDHGSVGTSVNFPVTFTNQYIIARASYVGSAWHICSTAFCGLGSVRVWGKD